MGIVAWLVADQGADQDFLASGRLMGAEQLLHPGIIIDAIDDDDLGVRQSLRRIRARLEQMRIVVWIAENARHRDVRAADLGREVAIEILRRDDLDRIRESGRAKRANGYRSEDMKLADHRTASPLWLSGAALRPDVCYVITVPMATLTGGEERDAPGAGC